MSLSSAELWQRISAHQLASPMQCRSWAADAAAGLSASEAIDGERMLQQLVAIGKLSQFQADILLSGSDQPLVRGGWRIIEPVNFAPRDANDVRVVWNDWWLATKTPTASPVWVRWLTAADLERDQIRQAHPSLPLALRHSQASASHLQSVAPPEMAAGSLQLSVSPLQGKLLSGLVADKPLVLPVVMQMLLQVSSALSALHATGLAHGRISPDRVCLDEAGDWQLLRDPLCGTTFGISRPDLGLIGSRLPGKLSAAHFMAPEFLLPAQAATLQTDCYALGCVAWLALVGKPPVTGTRAEQILAAHADRKLDVAELAQVPEPLTRCLLHCLAKNPEARFANAQQVHAGLVEAQRLIEAGVTSVTEPAPQPPQATPPQATAPQIPTPQTTSPQAAVPQTAVPAPKAPQGQKTPLAQPSGSAAPKPAAPKPTEPKPAEPKPVEPKPVVSRAVTPKPAAHAEQAEPPQPAPAARSTAPTVKPAATSKQPAAAKPTPAAPARAESVPSVAAPSEARSPTPAPTSQERSPAKQAVATPAPRTKPVTQPATAEAAAPVNASAPPAAPSEAPVVPAPAAPAATTPAPAAPARAASIPVSPSSVGPLTTVAAAASAAAPLEPATIASPAARVPGAGVGQSSVRSAVRRRAGKRKKTIPWLIPAMGAGALVALVLLILVLNGGLGSTSSSGSNQRTTTVASETGREGAAAAATDATRAEPTDPRLEYFEIVDSNMPVPWAPPREPEPLPLDLLPPGGQMFLSLRPAAMFSQRECKELLGLLDEDLGPSWRWLAEQTGVPLESIDQVVVAAYAGQSGVPQYALRVHLQSPQPLQQLKTAWGGPTETKVGEQVLLVGGARGYYVATQPLVDSQSVSEFMVAPADLAREAVELQGTVGPLTSQLEHLLQWTDRRAHVCVLLSPSFLFTEGRQLIEQAPERLADQLVQWLSRDMRGAMLSTSLDDQWFYEARLVGNSDRDAGAIQQKLNDALQKLPQEVESWFVGQSPHPYWRAIALRYPNMLRALAEQTRFGVEAGQAIANGYLPTQAAPNLLYATWIALQPSATMTTGSPAATTAAAPTAQQPLTPEQILARPITVVVDQQGIEVVLQLIGEQANEKLPPGTKPLRFELDGPAFQRAGFTRNQQVRDFKIEGQPVRAALTELAKIKNPVPGVTDLRSAEQKLIWVLAEVPDKPGEWQVSLTSREAATAEKKPLPPEFAPASP